MDVQRCTNEFDKLWGPAKGWHGLKPKPFQSGECPTKTAQTVLHWNCCVRFRWNAVEAHSSRKE